MEPTMINRIAHVHKAPRCLYCTRPSSRISRGQYGGPWCHAHRPGPRTPPIPGARVKPPGSSPAPPSRMRSIGRIVAYRESLLGSMLPLELLHWPPLQRLCLEVRPGLRERIGLRHVLWALADEAMGDPEGWTFVITRLAEGGWLHPYDPPRPSFGPGDGQRAAAARAEAAELARIKRRVPA